MTISRSSNLLCQVRGHKIYRVMGNYRRFIPRRYRLKTEIFDVMDFVNDLGWNSRDFTTDERKHISALKAHFTIHDYVMRPVLPYSSMVTSIWEKWFSYSWDFCTQYGKTLRVRVTRQNEIWRVDVLDMEYRLIVYHRVLTDEERNFWDAIILAPESVAHGMLRQWTSSDINQFVGDRITVVDAIKLPTLFPFQPLEEWGMLL